MLPDFIGIGPSRAATTWMYANLREHPGICVASIDKKTHFFDLYYGRGIDWYERLFSHCSPDRKKGELTETYIFYDEVPALIHRHIPAARIFTCLRNPIDRAFSAYHHLLRDGAITETFEEALIKFEKILVTDSLYLDHLKPYYDLFPSDQILVTLYDDIAVNPLEFIQGLYRFIGVDASYVPRGHDVIINETRAPRFRLVNKAMLLTHNLLRDLGLHGTIERLKKSSTLRRLRFKKAEESRPAAMAPETRERLQAVFRPHVEELSRFISRDLSHWR